MEPEELCGCPVARRAEVAGGFGLAPPAKWAARTRHAPAEAMQSTQATMSARESLSRLLGSSCHLVVLFPSLHGRG